MRWVYRRDDIKLCTSGSVFERLILTYFQKHYLPTFFRDGSQIGLNSRCSTKQTDHRIGYKFLICFSNQNLLYPCLYISFSAFMYRSPTLLVRIYLSLRVYLEKVPVPSRG